MTAIREALARYRAASQIPIGGELGLALAPEEILRPLLSSIESLESTLRNRHHVPMAVLENAKRAWAQSRQQIASLTTRQIRALCWEPSHATQPEFVRQIASHPDLPRNRRWIEGMVESYFSTWRTMVAPMVLEEALQRAVGTFQGRSKRLERYKPNAQRLFSPDAAAWLATEIVTKHRTVDETVVEWGVSKSGGLGEATATAALEEWTRRFEHEKTRLRGASAAQWFHQLTGQLLISDVASRISVARAVSSVILWDQAEKDDAIHAELRDLLLRHPHFGDPRLPSRRGNWDICAPEARQRVIGWLAKGDLLFFFKFVITNDPHGRRDFWLRYIDRAVDAHVALSNEDATRLRAQVKEKLSYSRAVGGQGASAFLMRFRGSSDLLCVEFSQTGNALHVHNTDAFNARFGSIRRHEFSIPEELKNATTRMHRISHVSGWQWTVQAFLARYGVRPT